MLHGDLLGERTRLTPAKTALVDVLTGNRFRYRDLDLRAARTARAWTGPLGVSKGDRVALLAHNRPEFLDAFFAAGKSGVILVPLSTRATSGELAAILRDAMPAVLIYGGEHVDTVRALSGEMDLPRAVALDQPARPRDDRWAELEAAVTGGPWDGPRCDPEDILALLYTSGTTGRPKGVMLPHRMVSWNGYNTALGWQLRETDVSPIFTPLYHAGGLGAFLTPIIAIGGTIVLHRGFDPGEVWRTLEKEGCTVVLGVPTIWKMLMDAPEYARADVSRVRWFISGGAPLPVSLQQAYQERGVVFRQGYGLTEVGVNCFAMTDEDSRRKLGSIGKPLMFTEVKLVDEAGCEVAEGEVGELCFRGPHVCQGYWNDPEATAAALDPEGWFHTGDAARKDEDGFFYIAGRRKDMIISGGVNVYPAEIELELAANPVLADSAVVGVADPTWGEVPVAFVVPAEGAAPTAEELSAFLVGRIARYKIPRRFVFMDALPRTPYGKVVKDDLRRLL
jgi:fatty-acyl-CoA synthase